MDRERKAALRAATAAARRQLSTSQRSAASSAAVERVLQLPDLAAATTVLLYAASTHEVDLGPLVGTLRARGVRTLFPRVRGEQLDLVAAADLRTLQLGYRGIHEPVGPTVVPDVVDVAVVPGVAFDRRGGRLGHGGGHYDRLLARLPIAAVRIGVCFACQVVPVVPREDHDEVVDVVVTERTTTRTGARDGLRA